jgi:hypothetical protein
MQGRVRTPKISFGRTGPMFDEIWVAAALIGLGLVILAASWAIHWALRLVSIGLLLFGGYLLLGGAFPPL